MNNESFNQGFCAQLEFHLTHTFGNSKRTELKGFCCDGVSMPFLDSQLTKKSVNDTRQIVTKAWLGYDGQTEFEMIIYFGPRSLSCYAKGLDLSDCLPSKETMDWINLDIQRNKIEVQLI